MPHWRKYLPLPGEPPVTGFQETGPCEFTLHTRGGTKVCRSMMRELELLYLYSLAREGFHDIGHIVDLGPYTGMSTFALASGLIAERLGQTHVFGLTIYFYRMAGSQAGNFRRRLGLSSRSFSLH